MSSTRRLNRMARAKKNRAASLSLTSLMDVFTILVLYLLVNQSSGTVLEPPKNIKLPESKVETKPSETIVISVSDDDVIVPGIPPLLVSEIMASDGDIVEAIRDRLLVIKSTVVKVGNDANDTSNTVTIMGNREIPFKVLKKVMSSCTAAGYTKIALAVNQK